MSERWIIYRASRVKGNLSFYTGKCKDDKKTYIIFHGNPNISYPIWVTDMTDKKVIIFNSYKDAIKEKKTLFLSQKGYRYGIDMYPEDRYND